MTLDHFVFRVGATYGSLVNRCSILDGDGGHANNRRSRE